MIYIFKKDDFVSVVYAEDTLTEEDKIGGIAVEELPLEEKKEGYYSVLDLDNDNKPYWKYVKIEETKE